MADNILPGTTYRDSEFTNGLTGACGPNASGMAQSWADQHYIGTWAVYSRMRAKGRCDPSGASTLAALAADAQDAGYHVDVLPYREPMPDATWRGFFTAHVGRQAIVMETANGQALKDYLTGAGENARNLEYHFIMVAGWHPGGLSSRTGTVLPAGWWCLDGDNFSTPIGPVTTNAMQFYPDSVLAAARPCAAMAVYPRVNISGGSMVPSGWKDDGTTLTAPNGKTVTLGFRDHVLNASGGWPAWDVPLEEAVGLPSVELGNSAIGVGTRQIFNSRALAWTQSRNVYEMYTGQELLAWIAKATAQQTMIDAQAKRIADLEAQITALQHQPPVSNPQEHAKAVALDALMACYNIK